MGLYSCIVARLLMGSLTGSLPTSYALTSCTLVIGGIAWVTCGRRSIRIRCGSSYISFLKAQSLRSTSAQCTVFTHGRIRFSIIILISFIKEGVRGIVLGHTSRLFRTSSCKLRQASHFLPKIISWFPRSIIRRGTLYYLRLLTRRQIHKILLIGCPTYPLYPHIGIGLGSSSSGIFKNLASFIAYLVLIKAKAFTPKLAKVEVKT